VVKYSSIYSQHLLRQGQEAVQVVHELDILSTEYLDDSPALGGELVGYVVKNFLLRLNQIEKKGGGDVMPDKHLCRLYLTKC
jgi:hypothetical protein